MGSTNFNLPPKVLQFLGLLVAFYLLCIFIEPDDNNWLWRLPSLIAGLPLLINNSVDYLMYEWMPISVWDPEIEEYEDKPGVREIAPSI